MQCNQVVSCGPLACSFTQSLSIFCTITFVFLRNTVILFEERIAPRESPGDQGKQVVDNLNCTT